MFTSITGPVEGTLIFDEIDDDFVAKEKSGCFWRHWFGLLGPADNRNFCACWRGPEKDPLHVLEQTKVRLIKESG